MQTLAVCHPDSFAPTSRCLIPHHPLPPSWSLHRRLRWQLLLTIAGLWLASVGVAVWALRTELDEVLDSALVATVHRVLTLPAEGRALQPPAPFGATIQTQLVDEQGQIVWRSHDAPVRAMSNAGRSARIYTDDGWRVAVEPSPDGRHVAVAAESLEERGEAILAVTGSLLIPVLVLLPMVALLVSWMLRKGFQPVERMRQALASRAPGDLSTVAQPGLPLELSSLAMSLDMTLQQVAQLRTAESHFAANSAHELRTPLAAARAQAQRLLAEVPGAPLQERTRALIRQIDRLETLSAKLLQMSRVHSGLALSSEPVDLNQLMDLVCREFSVPAGRLVRHPADLAVSAQGDLDALGIALRNLIENALRHAGPDAQVHVQVAAPAQIEVWDNGPGVAPELLETLRQPFSRGTTTASGSGLGLSIADEVARQSRGQLHLASPHAHGAGFSAILALIPT